MICKAVKFLKPIDIVIFLIALALTVFSAYAAYLQPQGRVSVLMRAENRDSVYYMDNNDNETVSLKGPVGHTIVRIENGRAWVESSPCDNQTCVATGVISRAGQWEACLPNSVLIMIQGDSTKDDDVDAVSW